MYKYVQVSYTRHRLTWALVYDCPHYTALTTLLDTTLAHASQHCPNAKDQTTRFQAPMKHTTKKKARHIFSCIQLL